METGKCYNSVSCVLSVVIIVFMISAVLYDLCISKPQMKQSINEINIEIKHINEVISQQSVNFSEFVEVVDSAIVK